MIATGLSQKEADCFAFGGLESLNSADVCNTAKMRLYKECANIYNCEKCKTNSCPTGASNTAECKTVAASSNPNNLFCITRLHKPSMGVHFIFQAVAGNIDQDFD